jgi:hypothetical protein
MKAKGRSTSMKTTPERSTSIEKTRPISWVNVISPNPRVDMTVRVQYTPVIHEYSFPSQAMRKWKIALYATTMTVRTDMKRMSMRTFCRVLLPAAMELNMEE